MPPALDILQANRWFVSPLSCCTINRESEMQSFEVSLSF